METRDQQIAREDIMADAAERFASNEAELQLLRAFVSFVNARLNKREN